MSIAARIVLLVGGGHAHLEVIRSADAFRAAGARLVLVDPGLAFAYSGGASAVLGGSLAACRNRIDFSRLCRRHGVERITGAAAGIDPARGSVRLEDGNTAPYDLVSFNVGSRVDAPAEADDRCYAAKPIADLDRLRADSLADRSTEACRVLVVGGGATGVEIAGNLRRLGEASGQPVAITLVAGSERLMEGLPARAGRIAANSLRRRGVAVVRDAKLAAIDGREALLTSGARLGFERLVFATGLVADPLITRLALPCDPRGGLHVDRTLRSIADRRVFAVGDCAAIRGLERPKAGVFGVRAAPVLIRNLLAALRGEPLAPYRPQRTWLRILDLGDDTGLAIRGPVVLHGAAMLRWKRRIDRHFLDRYRAPD